MPSPGVDDLDPGPGLWAPLFALLADMDGQIAALYAECGLSEVRPRFARPLMLVAGSPDGASGTSGPGLTIRALAGSCAVTHSAMSQTVAAMRRSGLVQTNAGADARTRVVRLTDRGRQVLPFVKAEWAATEAALAELEQDLPHPVTEVVAQVAQALAARPFAERIRTHLTAGPDGAAGRERWAGR